ncbi:AraC-like DNA-binding protein [Serratia fonticola]|uniref:AraC-like DNA-binding protein n=1 Tax=Serratia fonticola TaxID=47917 RepID=A0A542CZ93_SERFO|nr:AraC-like DNA-binding protein [Serratia fonticola]TQI96141.1 AraC-like DNA-binding protein [Serratia fonticola]TVZ70638.1 AraC-like DNA-binding protein [Serratia fonticola]
MRWRTIARWVTTEQQIEQGNAKAKLNWRLIFHNALASANWVSALQPLGAALIPPLCYLVLILQVRGPLGWRVVGHIYLEPALNLARLARKMGIPARKVSQAINQQAGMNVSQYVNQLRIQQAAQWLSCSDRPVTEIMLEAGFSTKSNFNREFLRVQGMSLSEWRKSYAVDS